MRIQGLGPPWLGGEYVNGDAKAEAEAGLGLGVPAREELKRIGQMGVRQRVRSEASDIESTHERDETLPPHIYVFRYQSGSGP